MITFKEVKKFPVLTLITLLASSGGRAVCRDGIFFFPKTKMAITIGKIHRGISSNTVRAKKVYQICHEDKMELKCSEKLMEWLRRTKMCLHRRIKVGCGGRNRLFTCDCESDVFGSRNDSWSFEFREVVVFLIRTSLKLNTTCRWSRRRNHKQSFKC